MKKSVFKIALLASVCLLINSCTKEQVKEDPKVLSKELSFEEEIWVSDVMEELFWEIEESNLWLDGTKEGRPQSDCRTITVEPLERGVFPKTITLDYGAGCEIKEGLFIRGKIVIVQSAGPQSEAWRKTISFQRYSVNDKRFEGGKTIAFVQDGHRGQPTWTIQSRIKIQWEEESFIQQSSQHTRVQISGWDTPKRVMDDQFYTQGSINGTNRMGKAYKCTITEPLLSGKSCNWITKGVLLYQARGESDMTLDYGDGNCDNVATLTKDGVSREIELKQ